ncbi:telomere repeat-binding protein 5-like isoform X2 [Telopea speciosissima]|uniref:telomere repeat-binding protein 5-like isoform X2 n=1 Tax=Telopea speciosissima TaxID=54955 RepID=UPI001CC79004|nr:telomere repeat-binding protein 5-like isoform X2 [Telopea speciosissima]
MVLQKRLDYGFVGYQVPAMPRASRSARGRSCVRKKVENNQMCAFDLLATVAGKILQERENSPAPSDPLTVKDHQYPVAKGIVKQEQVDEENQLKLESCDQGSCNESLFVSELRDHKQNNISKEFSHVQSVGGSGPSSVMTNPEHSEKSGSAEELVVGNGKSSFGNFPNKVKIGSSGFGKCADNTEAETEKPVDTEARKIGSVINGTIPDTCSTEGPMELDRKPQALVSSDSSVEVPLGRVHVPRRSLSGRRDDVKVVSRDDDENSSGCTQPSNVALKGFRSPPRIGDRRIRKLQASKCWKMAPKLKDGELSNSDEETKPVHRSRKSSYTRQRSQRNSPFKKRKLFDGRSMSTSDGGISSEGIANSPIKGIHRDVTGTASGASSSVAGPQATFRSRDSHVKLRIKSFRVPELFIEIPETATVGSLKRTVMEAVTAVLGGGLRVGVLLQGKKVRDDNNTLLQTGICNEDKLDTLGFTLEPNPTNSPPPLCSEDPSPRLPSDTPQQLTRYPASDVLDPGASIASLDPPMTNIGNGIESDHDSVPSPTDISADKITSDSRALVAVPAMSVEALAVVPFNPKSRRSEIVQRRIRRPFSVSEVEALVQAVEKLGTGRWRDVKLRAFDNAKHRTYVDLKDKWKTLVHTARISPQQRRGEPVPQELLDRVLSAHAYWSQQQAKQQAKQQSETCLLL